MANLAFGFVDFKHVKKSEVVSIAPVTFYAKLSPTQRNKTDAMRVSTDTKNSGGSGYLVAAATEGWAVVVDVNNAQIDGGAPVVTRTATLTLTSADHRTLIEALTGSFKTTFDTLCEYQKSYAEKRMTATEISASARLAYNNLVDTMGQLETVQGVAQNPAYTKLLTYLVRQLFGLNLLWLDTGGDNFGHVLKNAASWVIYALNDLTAALA